MARFSQGDLLYPYNTPLRHAGSGGSPRVRSVVPPADTARMDRLTNLERDVLAFEKLRDQPASRHEIDPSAASSVTTIVFTPGALFTTQ